MDRNRKNVTRRISVIGGFFIVFIGLALEHVRAESPKGLEVRVEGIKESAGEIGVAVFASRVGFPMHLEHSEEPQWIPLQDAQDKVVALFDSLPPGEYAIAVLNDKNGNRRIDRNSWGFPTEGVGFSNGQKVTRRVPRFEECKVTFKKDESLPVVIQLDYQTGIKPDETGEEKTDYSADKDAKGLRVLVEGIKKSMGEIGIALFAEKTGFSTRFEYVYEAEWVRLKSGQNIVQVLFDSLPAGEYAVSVLHDENGNRKMDRTVVGFPAEGVGFSNDQKVTLKAPSFSKCKFAFQPDKKKEISIKMDY